jgi:hypothetical protein
MYLAPIESHGVQNRTKWHGKEGRGSKDGLKGGCVRRRSRRDVVNQIENILEK